MVEIYHRQKSNVARHVKKIEVEVVVENMKVR